MDGVLAVYKERGFTSFDVVAKLRGVLHQKKIGHLGTLDPEAEGVLPVCVGRATKLADLFAGDRKVYRAVLYLGVDTDTQDACGTVLRRGEVPVDEALIRGVIASFVGTQDQLTPMYSARKVDGRKLVDLARSGREVERDSREITVESLDVLKIDLPRIELRIACSKGTYIRTICHDIGAALGCGGMMESLVREEAAGFSLKEAKKLGTIEALCLTAGPESVILPLEKLLERYPRKTLKPFADKAGFNGNVLTAESAAGEPAGEDGIFRLYSSHNELIGLYREEKDGRLKPFVMLPPEKEEEKPRDPRPSVVSVGKFDGIHLGHQKLLSVMNEHAEAGKLRKTLFSFSMSPQAVLEGRRAETLLTPEEKRNLAKTFGITGLSDYPFTDEIRRMSAEDFLTKILIGRLGMREIVAGPDCAFGYERRGNIAFLEEASKRLGFTLTVVPKVSYAGEIISSTRIRELLKEGRMEETAACLGYPYFFESRVGYGQHLGTAIGIPTANQIVPEGKLCPPCGVYVSILEADGKRYPAVSNLGVKPSVAERSAIGLETHVLDSSPELYGRVVRTKLLHYLRPERRFSSLGELKAALELDILQAKAYFDNNGNRSEVNA